MRRLNRWSMVADCVTLQSSVDGCICVTLQPSVDGCKEACSRQSRVCKSIVSPFDPTPHRTFNELRFALKQHAVKRQAIQLTGSIEPPIESPSESTTVD
eukprot:365024-Chlamydomonas_euryale.AAC.3